MTNRERLIREIAYDLWEQEGRPEGHSERLWLAAEARFEAHRDVKDMMKSVHHVRGGEARRRDGSNRSRLGDSASALNGSCGRRRSRRTGRSAGRLPADI